MEINNASSELQSTSASYQSSSSINDPSTSKNELPLDSGKRRDISPDQDLNGEMSQKRKCVEGFRENEGKNSLKEEMMVFPFQVCQQPMQMQATTSHLSNSHAMSDFYVGISSQCNFGMSQNNIPYTMNQSDVPVISGLNRDSAIASMNPYPNVFVPDPSMGMMPPVSGFCPMPIMSNALPNVTQKTVKVFTSCILYPPPPSSPPPSRRERPNGCQTVYVQGLPEKMTEDIVQEVFSECGEIATIRMTNKNFCHIKFTSELHVDQALLFSNYRIIIENKDDPAYSGYLHVDFAVSREDQYKCECLMRKMARAARHASLEDPFRSLAMIHNEDEVPAREQPQNEDSLMQTCQVLITWLERRERVKRHAKSEIKEQFIKLAEDKAKLLEENELLRNQLRAATNEAVLVKNEGEKKNAVLLETYHQTQQIYLMAQKKLEDTLKEKLALESRESATSDENQIASASNENFHLAPGVVGVTESETRLITLIATFLNVHPFGASIDYICSYLLKLDSNVVTRDVETLMKKFKTVFKEESTGIGATLEKKWFFLGFLNLA